MATIKEIAELACVSTTTVSNVIHGKTKKVSSSTIKKVEHLIKELVFYHLNPFTVINQMQIHGILCPEWFMGCYGICNLTMSFDCLFMQ